MRERNERRYQAQQLTATTPSSPSTISSPSSSSSTSSPDKFHIDTSRAMHMATWGLITGAPMLVWFRYLDRKIPTQGIRPIPYLRIIKKILINQSTFAVTMNINFFGWCLIQKHGVETEEKRQKSVVVLCIMICHTLTCNLMSASLSLFCIFVYCMGLYIILLDFCYYGVIN